MYGFIDWVLLLATAVLANYRPRRLFEQANAAGPIVDSIRELER
jgi:hypothetical protein